MSDPATYAGLRLLLASVTSEDDSFPGGALGEEVEQLAAVHEELHVGVAAVMLAVGLTLAGSAVLQTLLAALEDQGNPKTPDEVIDTIRDHLGAKIELLDLQERLAEIITELEPPEAAPGEQL